MSESIWWEPRGFMQDALMEVTVGDPGGKLPRVLVIDDERTAGDSCRLVLGQEGIDVSLVSTVREGLDVLLREPYDLILMDIEAAEEDDLQPIHRILDVDPAAVIVVVAGLASVDRAVSVIKEGAYDYLPKPFTPDELLIVVRRGLEKRRLDQESKAFREEKEAIERNFVTMVTHQLRSPLAAILQYFEVLLEGIGGELSEVQREMLERAQERLTSLMNLINDWLDMSRIREGEIVKRFQAVSLVQCVDSAIRGLDALAAQKQLELKVHLPEDLPPVQADADSLREVVANLVGNAVKYNRPGGRVEVRGRQDGDRIILDVADTGIGIDEKELPFIFDQFFRSREKEVREKEGTGLGLAIVDKIIRAHGGRIEVESRKGEGTRFRVFLNRALERDGPGFSPDQERGGG